MDKDFDNLEIIKTLDDDEDTKSLTQWFKEKWVDISRPKPGGGFEECGRYDANTGKYPKCVPASRAAKMTQGEIDSAVRRKRRAESTTKRVDKKPIYVPTDKKDLQQKSAIPTDPELYSRVKAEAKKRFNVYPSAYANAWLVREYKKRGGGYRTEQKSVNEKMHTGTPVWITSGAVIDIGEEEENAIFLVPEEKELAVALVSIAKKYGRFNQDGTGIWAGYESEKENSTSEIGVKCSNCVLYAGGDQCRIIEFAVHPNGKCRFAIIPENIVQSK